jgi:hypothetical protein
VPSVLQERRNRQYAERHRHDAGKHDRAQSLAPMSLGKASRRKRDAKNGNEQEREGDWSHARRCVGGTHPMR